MKLYDVPDGSRVKVLHNSNSTEPTPISHRTFKAGEELEFSHIDGMYSLCHDDNRKPVHLVSWAEVAVIREGPKA